MNIRQRLLDHLQGGSTATANDETVHQLYREFHHLPEDCEAHLEEVELWAHATLNVKSPSPRQNPVVVHFGIDLI